MTRFQPSLGEKISDVVGLSGHAILPIAENMRDQTWSNELHTLQETIAPKFIDKDGLIDIEAYDSRDNVKHVVGETALHGTQNS